MHDDVFEMCRWLDGRFQVVAAVNTDWFDHAGSSPSGALAVALWQYVAAAGQA